MEKKEYIKSSINNERTKALICYTINGSIGNVYIMLFMRINYKMSFLIPHFLVSIDMD